MMAMGRGSGRHAGSPRTTTIRQACALARARARRGDTSAPITLSMNGADSKVDPVKGINGGIVAPGHIRSSSFLGVGVHLPDERPSRVRALAEQPRELRQSKPALVPCRRLAIEPFSWLAIGGGLLVHVVDASAARHSRRRERVSAGRFPASSRGGRRSTKCALGGRDATLGEERRPRGGVSRRVPARARPRRPAIFYDLLGTDDGSLRHRHHSINNSAAASRPRRMLACSACVRTTFDTTWVDWKRVRRACSSPSRRSLRHPPPGMARRPDAAPVACAEPLSGSRSAIASRRASESSGKGLAAEARGFARGYELAQSPIAPCRSLAELVPIAHLRCCRLLGAAFDDLLLELPGHERLALDACSSRSELVTATTTKASSADLTGDYGPLLAATS